MNSQPTRDLISEHNLVMLMVRIMEGVVKHLEAGKPVEKPHLERIADFLRVFVDDCHHVKEEQALFPQIRKASDKHDAFIDKLLEEHAAGRKLVSEIMTVLKNYQAGGSAEEIIGNFNTYCDLLTKHVEKENINLMPIIDREFGLDELNQIEQGFQDLETKVLGPSKQEEYESLLKELLSVYCR